MLMIERSCSAVLQAKRSEVGGSQEKGVSTMAVAALQQIQRLTARHVEVLTGPQYLANPRAVLEFKLPLLTQEVGSIALLPS